MTRACASRGPQAAVEHRPGQCAAGAAQATGAARQSPSQLGPSGSRLSGSQAFSCLLPRQGPSSKRTSQLLSCSFTPTLTFQRCNAPQTRSVDHQLDGNQALPISPLALVIFTHHRAHCKAQLKSAGSSWKSKVNTAGQSLPVPVSLSWELPSPVGRHAAACAA